MHAGVNMLLNLPAVSAGPYSPRSRPAGEEGRTGTTLQPPIQHARLAYPSSYFNSIKHKTTSLIVVVFIKKYLLNVIKYTVFPLLLVPAGLHLGLKIDLSFLYRSSYKIIK